MDYICIEIGKDMKPTKIFVTYNPKNDFEQTLAVRLHTIGAVHGFEMLLPDRFNNNSVLNAETSYRIRQADYFILFSTSPLTPIVQQEVVAAFKHLKNKSKVIIIYDRVKNITHQEICTEVYIDTKRQSSQQILDEVISEIKKNAKKEETANAIGGIILIGLGLLALNSLTKSE